MRSSDINSASDDLEDVVETNQINDIVRSTRLHKFRASNDNKPQVNSKNKQ